MIRARSRPAVIALAIFAAALAAAAAPPAAGQTTPEPVRGGTLRVALSRWSPYSPVFMDLDPQGSYVEGGFALMQCCLVRTLMGAPDLPVSEGGGDLLPDLASDYPTVSPDGLTWTFQLKQGLHYAPPLVNVEITAPDVVRAIERVAKSGSDSYAYPYFSPIEGFERYATGHAGSISGLVTPNPYTLEVHVTEPVGDVSERLSIPAAAPIAPYGDRPLGVAQGYGLMQFGAHAVSTGPYMFERSPQLDFSKPGETAHALYSDADSKWVWVRDPSWDPSTDPLRAGLPDRIEFTVSTGGPASQAEMDRRNDDTVQMVLNGNADVAMTQMGGGATFEARRSFGGASGGPLVAEESAGEDLLGFRLVVPPFDDVHVRRAVSYVLDRTAYLRKSQGTVVAQSHLILDPFTENILSGYVPYRGSDLHAAMREMADSRYDRDHDGRCDVNACQHVRLACACTYADRALMRPLAALGMRVAFEPLPAAAIDPADSTVGMFTIGFGYDWQDPYPFFNQLLSSNGAYNSVLLGKSRAWLRSNGHAGYQVPSLDDGIAACQVLVGPARAWCWAALDQREMEDVVAMIPLGRKVAWQARGSNVAAFGVNWFGEPALDRMALAQAT